MAGQVVVNGLSVMDVIANLRKKNKRYIANALDSLEQTLGENHPHYVEVRKIFLDNFNDYTRSVLVSFIGDIEGLE